VKGARPLLLAAAVATALAAPASAGPTKTIRLAWSGRISGLGATALRDTNVRVRFSYFAGRALPAAPGFGWITDHVVRVN
jgi:hypothetical protein